jgi:alpha-glucoside transport system substrate-binding protein
MLATANIFLFGAEDLMPAAVEDAFWQAAVNYIQDPGQLNNILRAPHTTAHFSPP